VDLEKIHSRKLLNFHGYHPDIAVYTKQLLTLFFLPRQVNLENSNVFKIRIS